MEFSNFSARGGCALGAKFLILNCKFLRQRAVFVITAASLLAVEILSFFSHAYPATAGVVFFAVAATFATLAFWRLEYGVYFVLAELFLGGKGHLLEFHGISLRIAIFCVIMGIWAGKMIVKKQKPAFFKSKLFKYYLALAVFVMAGILIGFLRGNGFHDIVLDANAWLYFLIVFPLYEAIKDEKQLKNILEIFLAAVTIISFKTIGLFLIFSRSGFDLRSAQAGGVDANSLIFEIYKWVRNSGAGEITLFDGFYRIFLQPQVFVMVGFFVLLWLLTKNKLSQISHSAEFCDNHNCGVFIILSIVSSTLFISFSRSFWVGLMAGGLVFLWFLVKFRYQVPIGYLVPKFLLTITVGILITFAIAPGIFGAFGGRVSVRTGESASASRMNLLPKMWEQIKENIIIGSGFGATIIYETKDPRQLEINPSGKYETYAFEWNYLDIWMKIGIFGFLAYLLLIYKTFIFEYKNGAVNFGLICALIALCATNVFSPYLNHPLGIGAIILIGLIGQIRPISLIK